MTLYAKRGSKAENHSSSRVKTASGFGAYYKGTLTGGAIASLKKSMTDDVSSCCKNLCKRSNGSVLFGTTYQCLKEFDFDFVWNEMTANIPFLVVIFKAASGKNGIIESATRVKYGFVYFVLMNERWLELGLMKCVNIVLVIEGGCTEHAGMKYVSSKQIL